MSKLFLTEEEKNIILRCVLDNSFFEKCLEDDKKSYLAVMSQDSSLIDSIMEEQDTSGYL